jgi:hypothetical protein
MTEFEVIEIMGEKDSYLDLLGIDWAYENFVVIDLKKEIMTFEAYGMKVTQPLYPYQGPCYTDLVGMDMEEDNHDHLYTLIAGEHAHYINPTVDGSVSWHNIHPVVEDLEVAFEK